MSTPKITTRLSLENEKLFIDTVGRYSIRSSTNGHRKRCLEGYIEALMTYPRSHPFGWTLRQVYDLIEYARQMYADEFIFRK